MEFFDSAYNYVISAVIGMLVALCAMLTAQKMPQGRKYASYGNARKQLFLLFATIAVDLILSLVAYRLQVSAHADTLVDILCYTPVALIFLTLTRTLMEYKGGSTSVKATLLCAWGILVIIGTTNEILFYNGDIEPNTYKTVFACDVAVWVCLIMCIATLVAVTFRRAQHDLANFYSDDVARRMEWLRKSFVIFLLWGMASPLAAVGPSWLNTIYTGLGSAVYLYLGISFINYGSVYVRLKANESDEESQAQYASETGNARSLDSIKEWEANKLYRTPGVTIEMMAASLSVPAQSLAATINDQHNCTFREYVTNLRIRDAQTLLVHYPDKAIGEIASMTGFASEDEMENAFIQMVYVSPKEWRKGVLSLIN